MGWERTLSVLDVQGTTVTSSTYCGDAPNCTSIGGKSWIPYLGYFRSLLNRILNPVFGSLGWSAGGGCHQTGVGPGFVPSQETNFLTLEVSWHSFLERVGGSNGGYITSRKISLPAKGMPAQISGGGVPLAGRTWFITCWFNFRTNLVNVISYGLLRL